MEIGIVDPDTGRRLRVGEVGELRTRSPYNMAGYWRKPDETASTIDAKGGSATETQGYFDADGYIYLHDRIKDMIVSGGKNIYPAEVENVLHSHPAVVDAAVIGVPDQSGARRSKPSSSSLPTPTWTNRDVIAHCRANLAHYKCPTSVDTTDALPRNPSGKIRSENLRAPYWAGAGALHQLRWRRLPPTPPPPPLASLRKHTKTPPTNPPAPPPPPTPPPRRALRVIPLPPPPLRR